MDDIDWGSLISGIFSVWGLVLLLLIICLGKWLWDIAKKGSKWKGLPWNWKSFLVAILIAIVINVVGSAFFEVKPRKNIIWTAWWIYLTIEAWKYWKWKALLPYPIYGVTVIIAGLIMASIDVEYESWTTVIVAGTLNIGGLIIFSWLLAKSKKEIVEDATGSPELKRENDLNQRGENAVRTGSVTPPTNVTPVTTTFLAPEKATPSNPTTVKQDQAELEKSVDGYVSELKGRGIVDVQDTPNSVSIPNVDLNSLDKSLSINEAFYEKAFNELESADKKVGLWAKVFAEAQGNESLAKANYLKIRSGQLAIEYKQALLEEEHQREEAEKIAEMERQRQEREKIPKEQLRSLAKLIQSQPYVSKAKDLVNKLGGTFKDSRFSWFLSGKMIVNLYGETHEFSSEYDFAQ